MPKQNTSLENQNEPKYNSLIGCTSDFFVPHSEANHLNAQDVIHSLVAGAKDISIATFNCFDGGTKLVIKDEIVANLIYEIQTKLEMIEKLLPMAFEYEGQ
ncbi:MAG: hypothetical protein RSC05_14085 [Acinetobacter sp.]|jgi:hypothetical protein